MIATRANACAFLVLSLLALVVLAGNVGGEHSAAEGFVKSGMLGPIGNVLKTFDDEREVQEAHEQAAEPRDQRVAQREARVQEEERAEEERAQAEAPGEASGP